MSKRILHALMQLFAIIARPRSYPEQKRAVVEVFLKEQLNHDTVHYYLRTYDSYYRNQQNRLSFNKSPRKRTSSNSVRLLKLCSQINEELTLQQKIVVLIHVFMFIRSESHLSHQELEFVDSVGIGFNIDLKDYQRIKSLSLGLFDHIDQDPNLLVIGSLYQKHIEKDKQLIRRGLHGHIRILNVKSANLHLFRYDGRQELYQNNLLVKNNQVHVFTVGSSIKGAMMAPIYHSDIVNRFNIDQSRVAVCFQVRNIRYSFPGGQMALQAIDFKAQTGQLVGIMGVSGAGKSTLLNVLNGNYLPDSGQVTVNGIDLHHSKRSIRGLIDYVTQDDLLIEELTVYENLYFNTRLCFANMSNYEINRMVVRMLDHLGLQRVRQLKVGSHLENIISGGERKRLNMALSLIREPAILFLDEPTSGLSSRDSIIIIDLLKDLALRGKLIFVVLHQPSSEIFKMLDRLLLLDTGGYLIYEGYPVDALNYFKEHIHQSDWKAGLCNVCGTVNPELIFDIIETQIVDEFGKNTHHRKISPKQWYELFMKHRREQETEGEACPGLEVYDGQLPESKSKIPPWLKQWMIFCRRDWLSKLSNRQYLIINILETPVLAFLLSIIIKYRPLSDTQIGYNLLNNKNLTVYIFIAVIIAIFIGLTLSAQEILRDRRILRRERFLNLSRSSYLCSKITVLTVISAIQASLFVGIGHYIMELQELFWYYWLIWFSTACSANMLGLIISDSFKTSVTIYILIPFLIIPQIILSGVMIPFDELNPSISRSSKVPWYSELIIARWSYEALAVKQFKDNSYQREFYDYDKQMIIANYKNDFWLNALRQKHSICKQLINKPESADSLAYHLNLICRELQYEAKFGQHADLIDCPLIKGLSFRTLNKTKLEELDKQFDRLKKAYNQDFNQAFVARDKHVKRLQDRLGEKALIRLKEDHHNQRLEDLLRNRHGKIWIAEFNGRLWPKKEAIFYDGNSNWLRAHFYAPRKRIANQQIDTFWANLLVIWLFTIFQYVVLYYGLLRRLVTIFENDKKNKNNNR